MSTDVTHIHAHDLIEVKQTMSAKPICEFRSCRSPELRGQCLQNGRRVAIVAVGIITM